MEEEAEGIEKQPKHEGGEGTEEIQCRRKEGKRFEGEGGVGALR